MNDFVRYLLGSYFIFEGKVALDESNCMNDVEKIVEKVPFGQAKWTDDVAEQYTKDVLNNFKCYDLEDFYRNGTKAKPLKDEKARRIYATFKKYRGKVVNDEIMYDCDIDTSKTYYIGTTDFTTDQLEKMFGPVVKTGGEKDKYRYEYKFAYKNQKISLYDWIIDSGFYAKDKIEWHLASDTDDHVIIETFIQQLKQKLKTMRQ